MFTGLIQDVGVILTLESKAMTELWIESSLEPPFVLGESIAVSGCCLTVVEFVGQKFKVEASLETLRCTTLGGFRAGARVNLERAMRLSDRLGGHIVQGHVDGVAALLEQRPEGGSRVMRWELPTALAPLFVEKGSVTVDGVSLTINALDADSFSVALIPETLRRTTLGAHGVGDRVNLEADLIGKHVARLFNATARGGG